jgi:hypothetical protein
MNVTKYSAEILKYIFLITYLVEGMKLALLQCFRLV